NMFLSTRLFHSLVYPLSYPYFCIMRSLSTRIIFSNTCARSSWCLVLPFAHNLVLLLYLWYNIFFYPNSCTVLITLKFNQQFKCVPSYHFLQFYNQRVEINIRSSSVL